MGWSIQRRGTVEELASWPTAKELEWIERMNAGSSTALQKAFAAGIALIESGCYGGLEQRYQLTIAGHCNPAHQPVEGRANDYINISVHQLYNEYTYRDRDVRSS